MAQSPQTLSEDERRILAAWAADCAADVLEIYKDAVPGDLRVRGAIDLARAFAVGELTAGDAIRQRGGQAGAAAREAPTEAARAAAYVAEQAAAVAHMGAHALGAAGYAVKASVLAAGRTDPADSDAIAKAEAHRLAVTMPDQVAQVLALLPALGENRSGPLAQGRLSSGYVGTAIRTIQSRINARLGGVVRADLGPVYEAAWSDWACEDQALWEVTVDDDGGS